MLYTRDTVLVRSLRTGRHQRRPQQRGDSRRPRGLPQPMRSIEERPTHVADRVEAGHFEGDLIMGASNRTAIATLVERSRRNVTLVRVGANRTAAVAVGAGQAVVDVDPAGGHAEGVLGVALGGEVLAVSGDPGVADLQFGPAQCVPL